MNAVTRERFPHPKVLDRERVGLPTEDLCTRCGRPKDEPFSHLPEALGGGCIDHDDKSCPMCGGLDRCERWCELARLDR